VLQAVRSKYATESDMMTTAPALVVLVVEMLVLVNGELAQRKKLVVRLRDSNK
jgi:hypothetical protein